jgi:hypothetical protein
MIMSLFGKGFDINKNTDLDERVSSIKDISVFVSDYKKPYNTWQDALQLALYFVDNNGGGTVILPQKKIVECSKSGEKDTNATTLSGSIQKHSFCIEIGSNTNIDLNECTIRLKDNQNASLFVNKNMLVGISAMTNISIHNGVFDMNCQNQTNPLTSTMDAITLFNVTGVNLNNIKYKNIRTSSFKLLAVNNFYIDNQFTYYSDGDAYRIGAVLTGHPYELRCQDGVIGSLEAENCSINKNGTLQGNPVIASIKNVQIKQIRAKSCGGGFKFQDGCENIMIGQAIFNGSLNKDNFNSSNNSGFKIQGGSNANPIRMTIGEIISTDCEGEGLYIEAANSISIGRYIGINNGSSAQRSDVRIGNGGRIDVSSISSTNAGSSGVEFRSDLYDYQIGTINVLNAGSVVSAAGVTNSSTNGIIQSVIAKDDRAIKMMTYGYSVTSLALSNTLHSLSVEGSKNLPFKLDAYGNDIKKVIIDKTASTSNTITLTAGGTSTVVSNPNVKSFNRGGTIGYNVPIIEIIPANTPARNLLTKPLSYAVSAIGGFTIFHPTAVGTEKFIYKVNGYVLSDTNIATNSVYDSFNRTDNPTSIGTTETGHTWTLNGTWGIISGQAYSTSTSGTIRATVNANISDAEAGVIFAVVTNDQRFIFRQLDTSNEWYVSANTVGGTYLVYKRVAGSLTVVSTINSVPNNGDAIKTILKGSNIKVYINDILGADITDSFNSTATIYGMRINDFSGVSRFDDFRVDE